MNSVAHSPLTDALDRMAHRHGFSQEAAQAMLDAMVRGGGMAQFNHPEFGGSGQWMPGGMTMVSDLSNHGLAARVDALCRDIAEWVASQPPPVPGGAVSPATFQSQSQSQGPGSFGSPDSFAHAGAAGQGSGGGAGTGDWWPQGLGVPSSTGAQNGSRYAYFAATHRLAVEQAGRVKVFDTRDHRISGFSQQQGGAGGMAFSSQHGTVDLSALPQVAGHGEDNRTPQAAGTDRPAASPAPQRPAEPAARTTPSHGAADHDTLLSTIGKLAELHERGVLSQEEFSAKKADLLGRI